MYGSIVLQILNDSCLKLHEMLNDSIMSLWVSLSASVAAVCDKYLILVETFRTISAYVEINVAGFRKIIKQFHKQIPEYVILYFFPYPHDLLVLPVRFWNLNILISHWTFCEPRIASKALDKI